MKKPGNQPPHQADNEDGKLSEIHLIWIGALGILAACLGQALLERYQLIGLVPALFALIIWALRHPTENAPRQTPIFILVTAVAAVFVAHLWHIRSFPPGVFFDEAVNIRESLDLVNPLRLEVWSYPLSGRPTLFLYLLGFVQELFGGYWMVARLFVVFVNLATVGVMFWALRPLTGRSVAAIASIIFGISAYHILYSRIVYEASISTLVLLFSVGAVGRATRDDRFRWWLIWGASLGVGLWTYNAFRLVPLFSTFGVLVWALRNRDRLARTTLGIAAAAVVALLIVSPLIPIVVDNFGLFTFRATELSVFSEARAAGSLQPIVHNLVTYGLMFFANPETSNQMYQSPAFSPPTAVLLWIGIGAAIAMLARRQKGFAGVVLFWLAAGLVPGILTLSIEAPHWCRTLYALPAASIIAALGLLAVADLAGPRFRGFVASTLLLLIIAGEIWAFSTRIENDPRYYEFFYPRASNAAMLARARVAEGRDVLVSDENATEPYQEFVFWTIVGSETEQISALQMWTNLPWPRSPRDTSVLIAPRDHRFVDFLFGLYPGATLEITPAPWGIELIREVTIPAMTPEPGGRSAGLLIRRHGVYTFTDLEGFGLHLEGEEVREGDEFAIPAGIWRVECDRSCSQTEMRLFGPEEISFRDALFDDSRAGHGLLATYQNSDGSRSIQLDRLIFANQRGINQSNFSVLWQGSLTVLQTGAYQLRLLADDHALVTVDEERVLHYPFEEGIYDETIVMDLETGEHPIEIEFAKLKGGIQFELWWAPPGAGDFHPIPLELLSPSSGPERVVESDSPI